MLRNLSAAIEIDATFSQTSAEDAALRIAAGTMKVRRDANPKREFAVTFSQLGKLNPIFASDVKDLVDCFSVLASDASECDSPCILGLAESGIVPSFAMHQACIAQGRRSQWLCTSRRNNGGHGFCEPHSHAPHHYLPTESPSDPIDELWIVEDEITTGNTLANLLHCIRLARMARRVRIFTLLDTRSYARQGLPCFENVSVQSVLKTTSDFWNDDSFEMSSDVAPRQYHEKVQYVAGESITRSLPFLMTGEVRSLQHITISPWLVDGHHILSRQQLTQGYYLYNAGADWRG
jgi:hypothetical protein